MVFCVNKGERAREAGREGDEEREIERKLPCRAMQLCVVQCEATLDAYVMV